MSRAYSMNVKVEGVNTKQTAKIIDDVLMMECGAEDCGWVYDHEYNSAFDMCLCGGESEEQFADRISKSIWKALGKYHPICVTETYLEDLPYEMYSKDEDDYNQLMA